MNIHKRNNNANQINQNNVKTNRNTQCNVIQNIKQKHALTQM